MNKKYIEKLEFNKILNTLANNCITTVGKSIALCLQPETKKDIVLNLLKETSEATSLISKKHLPPFVEIADINYILKNLKSNGILNTKSLLDVANILRVTNNLKNYYISDNDERSTLFPILENYFSSLYINLSIRFRIRTLYIG